MCCRGLQPPHCIMRRATAGAGAGAAPHQAMAEVLQQAWCVWQFQMQATVEMHHFCGAASTHRNWFSCALVMVWLPCVIWVTICSGSVALGVASAAQGRETRQASQGEQGCSLACVSVVMQMPGTEVMKEQVGGQASTLGLLSRSVRQLRR